ncbi:MAG: PA14 domain-containing protein [Chitinophagaceae bacterium]
MKKSALLALFGMMMILSSVNAQNIFSPTDVVTNYPGAASAVQHAAGKIGTWYRTQRMSWSTTQWKCYIYNGMAFRLRFPNGYNAADTVTKYPMIIFFHGGGEIAPISDNENQLLWGAKDFQDSINAGKFNAFMLFPQVTAVGWDYPYYDKVNTILDTLKRYNNMDEDRVISMGLSNGGFASIAYAINFPRRASTVIGSSPALISTFTTEAKQYFTHIPLYVSSGGLDTNPEPGDVKEFVDSFAAKGGDVKWSFFPSLGHLTWQQQWAEGNLVNYWKNAHKANPLIFFKKSVFCSDSVVATKVGITSGYPQYQWQKDGIDIPSATKNELDITTFGTYRVRFKRLVNGAWSAWSPKPAVIAPRVAVATPAIVITSLKSRVLPAPDGSITVPLELTEGYPSYEWRRVSDNVLVSTSRTFNAPAGVYKGLIAGCSRTFSPDFTVVNATASPKPDVAISLTATRATTTKINLAWSLARVTNNNPAFYEIYRSTTPGGALALIAVIASINKTYSDQTGVNALSEYYYKVRSVNEISSAALSNEATAFESVAPSTPTGLKVVNTGKTFVTLDWNNSTDNIGVTGYDVFISGVRKYSTSESSITADSLLPNTAYSFTVKARDLSGNLSTASLSASGTTTTLANGLKYRFFTGTWDSLPNFNTLTYAKNGTSATPDLAVRTSGVNDYFGFVWEGHIVIPTTGAYTFELASDDGSALYLDKFYSPDDTAFIDNDGGHGDVPGKANSITLTAGLHPIAMTYFEIAGGQSMNLYWSGPGFTRQLVPATAYIETVAVVDVTAPTTPGTLSATFTGKNTVDLKWGASTDAVGVAGYNIYRNDTLKYQTSGTGVTGTADSLKANTSYIFKVKARDAAGNLSAFSNAFTVTTQSLANGLKYQYYEGNWDSLPNFNMLTPLKTGTTPNIDISLRNTGVNDYFGFVWEGYITIPTSGTYTFELGSDDGSKFYWNTLYNPTAVALVNNDFGHGETPTVSKSIEVVAGVYPVSITYFEKWGGEAMKLFWTGPGIVRAQVPNSAFIETAPIVDIQAPTTPANMRVTYTGKNSVSLAWDNSADNVGVTGYDFYINNVKQTTSLNTAITVDTLTASTAYSFKVQARDASGNLSGFSATASTTTTGGSSGLAYKYYEGNWDSLPNFNLLTPVKTGNTANVDISVRPTGVNDYFAFLWEGKITIPVTGTYTFELASDDGSKFYIGAPYSPTATALVNNDYGHGETPTVSKSIMLTAGVYPVAITYFEKWGGESMNVYWTGPNFSRQLIPNAAFIETAIQADVTPPTTPANFKTTYTGRSFIDLSWSNSTDAVGVTGYDVYVNGSLTPVTTTGNTLTVSSLTPNTVYTFKVQAKDAAGNLSAFSTISANSTASGLRYKYYEGDWNLLPNFNTLTAVKKGNSPNIDVTPRNQDDYYAFVWEGYINIPNTGNYTFELSSDDGSKFYFNTLYDPTAMALVNNDGTHGDQPTVSGTRMITAGIYPVTITYFEKWGGENMQLYWTGPGINRQLVPNEAFTENFTVTVNSLIQGTGVQGVSGVISTESAAAMSPVNLEKSLKIKAYPNPFVDKMQVQFNNPTSGNRITAVVYDSYGRAIISKDFGTLAAGNNVLTVNTGSEVKPGIYMVRLNINGVPASMWKMIKEKK